MIAPPRPWTCRAGVLFFTALLASACAGSSSAVREAAAHHVYSQPLPHLWPQVEAFMTGEGYTWRSAQGQYVLRTDWRETGTSGTNRTLVSYLVQGEQHPSGGSMLRVSRGIKAAPNNQSGTLSANTGSGANSTLENWDRMAQDEVAWQSQRAIYAPTRDLDMELALMRKLDPAAASRLEKPDSNASP
jgi:uncharacterized lipoprotein